MSHHFGVGLNATLRRRNHSNYEGDGGTCPTRGGDEFHFKVGVSIGAYGYS